MSETPYENVGISPPTEFNPPPKRPGVLTAFSIIGICLGVFSLLGTCCGVVGLAAQSMMLDFLESMAEQNPPPAGTPDPVEIMKLTMDLQAEFMIFTIPLMIIGLVVGICLLMGGVGTLKHTSWGRGLLSISYLVSVITGLIGVAVNAYVQLQTIEEMKKLFEGMPNMEQQMASQYVGMVIGIGFGLFMLLLYVLGWWFTSRPKIKEWYQTNLAPLDD